MRRLLRIPLPARRQAERDIDAEFRLHLELRASELVAERGLAWDDALEEARRLFGNEARARAELVEAGMRFVNEQRRRERLGDVLRDLRYAVRTLVRAPLFTLVAVLTLALGIGANTAIFSVVDAVLIRPLPVHEPDRLAMIWEAKERDGPDDRNVVNPANYLDWRERSRMFRGMAGVYDGRGTVLVGDEPQEVASQLVHPSFFEVLGVRPLRGRTFVPEDGLENSPNGSVAIISHRFWREQFGGDPDIVGKDLVFTTARRQIVGVMGPELDFFAPEVAYWTPTDYTFGNRTSMGRFMRVVGRLAPGATMEQARDEMATIAAHLREEHPDFNASWSTNVVPLNEQVKGNVRAALYVLLGAVGVLLLVTCVNVANLLMVRAAARRSEIAVRAALGAGRGRIVRGLLTESVMLATLGGVVGTLLAYGATRLLALSVTRALEIPRLADATVDLRVLGFTALVALAVGILFGLAPAAEAFSADLVAALRQGGRGGGGVRTRRIRSAIVVAEVALSLLLLVSAGLLLRSFTELQRTDLGIQPENVITGRVTLRGEQYSTPDAQLQFFQRAHAALAGLPDVRAVGSVSWLPLGGGVSATGYYLPERPRPSGGDMLVTEVQAIEGDLFRAIGIELERGRAFNERDVAGSTQVVVVNRAFVEQTWPGEDPLGRQFVLPWDEDRLLEVVGVVGNVRQSEVATEPRAGVYLPLAQFPGFGFANVVVRTDAAPSNLDAQIVQRIHEIDPQLAVANLRLMRDIVADAVARPRLISTLVACFAALALILAALGLYGVLAYAVSLRRRELSIRQALGAGRGEVARMVLGEGLRLAVLGIAIGTFVALYATRALSGILYRVDTTEPAVFGATAVLLLAIAGVASAVPALRAARLDPARAIRDE